MRHAARLSRQSAMVKREEDKATIKKTKRTTGWAHE
jgi:hypothetical protein